jgi:hypothetical protein
MPRTLLAYLRRYILSLLLRDRVLQYDWRGVDIITLALGHPQTNAAVGPCLYIMISIAGRDSEVTLKGKRVSWIVG